MRACLIQKIWNRQDTGPWINYVRVMVISKQQKFTKYQVMSFSLGESVCMCVHVSNALTRAFIHVDTWERYSWGRVFAILILT